ncbi:hypothetical protein SHANETTE_6 [Bacillus phage Shanette]|uniref:Uncharacterized protein n=1 Tax=Bacillus phage Shanette TaxID=1296656 RepID=S5MN00_9CAUD|nr:hypothetical protein AVV46_gp006 [Bacillus phage Shanette]AGR47115.1 hypothetical protein SHANETTE_6 [Bacillus phage Shanette]
MVYMKLLWTITYTKDGLQLFLEAENKIEAVNMIDYLVHEGVSLASITVFPHCTGQPASEFYVEVPDLELGQYCIMFTDGDPIIVDSEGVLVDSDDPECPNTVDGVWNKLPGIATEWASVKEQVDAGVDFGTGYYKLEVDNQISGTIQRIVRGTL